MDWITRHSVKRSLVDLGLYGVITWTDAGYDMLEVRAPSGTCYLPPKRLAVALASAVELIDGDDVESRVWLFLRAAAGMDAHETAVHCVCHGCWSARARTLGCVGVA